MSMRSLIRPVQQVSQPYLRINPAWTIAKRYSGTAVNKPSDQSNTVQQPMTSTGTTSSNSTTVDSSVATTPEKEKVEEKKEVKKEEEHGYAFGAHHWNMERGAAIALIPLLSTQLVYGAHPVVDGLLGVVLPYHIYMGFDSCIVDYIPKRVYPRLHKLSMWTLKASTGLVMWGCYEFNTNEIGITEFMQRLFSA
ncbi:CybS-domain-containing protein [Pilobolus umbonatus]|nr:CybS-domain-containing protein [Pilobolus umbonatus]